MNDETPWGPWRAYSDGVGSCIGPEEDEVALVTPAWGGSDWRWWTLGDLYPGKAPDEPTARAAALASLEARGVPKVST